MITPKDFAQRVSDLEKDGGIVELSDGMIDQVVGGLGTGPEFHDSFPDSHVENGSGPTFVDNFSDVIHV